MTSRMASSELKNLEVGNLVTWRIVPFLYLKVTNIYKQPNYCFTLSCLLLFPNSDVISWSQLLDSLGGGENSV